MAQLPASKVGENGCFMIKGFKVSVCERAVCHLPVYRSTLLVNDLTTGLPASPAVTTML